MDDFNGIVSELVLLEHNNIVSMGRVGLWPGDLKGLQVNNTEAYTFLHSSDSARAAAAQTMMIARFPHTTS